MTAERRVHPAFRKEDVARPLNFLKQLETRAQVFLRRSSAQGMVQIGDAVEHPRFAATVRSARERRATAKPSARSRQWPRLSAAADCKSRPGIARIKAAENKNDAALIQ